MIKFQLFKPGQSEAGYLDKGGFVVKKLEAYYVTSDFMEVTPGATISYEGLSYVGSEQRGCFYDMYQNFVSYFDLQVEGATMIVPSNCYYARITVCKKTKMNLFYDTLEEGSINDISGSNEAGVTFTRSHGDTITIGDSDVVSQLVMGGEYTVSTSVPVYQVMLYYYRSTATGMKYDHCEGTTFNEKLQEYTFTVPDNLSTYKYVRFKFYTPDMNHDFNVMLNAGDYVLEYTEPTLIDSDDTTTFKFYILQEAYESFRNDLYNYMKLTLSPNLTEKDLDVIIRLIG